MSGGSFDYAYFHTAQFADALENKLDNPNEYCNWDPEVVLILRKLVNDARNVSVRMKEAEWLYSADTSEKTFLERLKNEIGN